MLYVIIMSTAAAVKEMFRTFKFRYLRKIQIVVVNATNKRTYHRYMCLLVPNIAGIFSR